MEKKIINSFGSIVIPKNVRDELEISGTTMLWVDVRESRNGEKEIVLKKFNDADAVLSKYKKWAEVVARISECSVSIVWNNTVLSMSTASTTQSFVGRNITINPELAANFKKCSDAIISDPSSVSFLPNGDGDVAAYFRLEDVGDDLCFFVVIKGTKYAGKKISKSEEVRRFGIIKDIMYKL